MKIIRLLVCAALVTMSLAVSAAPAGSVFTYQGELQQLGTPSNGSFDMEFRLFDAETEGIELGMAERLVAVVDGIFTVELDFGAAVLNGQQLWLEITLAGPQPDVPEVGIVMSPRQSITATPYAVRALSVTPGSITADDIAPDSIGITQIDQSVVQRRIAPGCASGEFIREVAEDGTVTCAPAEAGGSGTVTAIYMGYGLAGPNIYTSGTLSVDTAEVQKRIVAQCPPRLMMVGVYEDGTPQCYAVPGIHTVVTVGAIGGYDATQAPAMAIGEDGFPVMAFRTVTGANIGVIKCNDVACSGDNEQYTQVSTDQAYGVDIAIGADGYPVLIYYDSVKQGLFMIKCNDAACAGGDETNSTVDDPTNNVGEYPSLAVPADGLPVMSYIDKDTGNLRLTKCTDTACTGAKTFSVADPNCPDTRSVSLAIGSDGYPVISYWCGKAGAGGLWVTKCANASCAGGQTWSRVDPAGSFSETSIAIGADGYPVISYYEMFDGALRVAKCNDLGCSGGDETLSVVHDTEKLVGFGNSIAVGADGLPVIAYTSFDDSVGRDQWVAKCNDAACSGDDETLTEVDGSVNNDARFPDIEIGADNLPIVLYEDSTFSRLRVTHCGTSDCRD